MAVQAAKGTLIKLGTATSPPTFSTIAQVRSIDGPTTSAEVVDITTHSTAGKWRERLSVLGDPGEISFEINFDPSEATHSFTTGLWKLLSELEKRPYQLVLAGNSGTLQFHAYVTRHAIRAPVDGVLGAAITLAIAGPVSTGS
jgi:predicted secreted protein